MQYKRKTIGVLVGGVLNTFAERLCHGVSRMCQELDYDMVVFPGKYIDRDLSDNYDLMYEYQNNTVYEYPAVCDIDGLIVAAGSIGCHTTEEAVNRFLSKFKNIPTILVASQFDGFPNISYDNFSGVKAGIEFMIDVCGCKHICMIGGLATNTDARERKQAFINTLDEYGIEFSDKIFEAGTLARNCHPACRRLLDRNPDVDGVFCVNDDTALALYDVLRERGLKPGVDVKIFGYDNTIEGMKADPAISSVNADITNLGKEAVKALKRAFAGETIESIVLPAQFIPRKSIGVFNTTESNTDISEVFDNLFFNYIVIKTQEETEHLFNLFDSIIRFLKSLVNFNEQIREREFKQMIDEFLASGALEYCDTEMLLQYFEKIRIDAENRLPVKNINMLLRIYNNLYMRIIRNQDKRSDMRKTANQIFSYEMKVFIMNTLRFSSSNDLTYGKMVDYLGWLNIKNAHIYTFKEEIAHLFGEKYDVPEEVLLKVKLKNGRTLNIAESRQTRKTCDVIREVVNGPERGDYIFVPLFFEEIQHGFMLCDLTEEMYSDAEFVASQMSAVSKIISVIRENERIQMQLEEHIVAIRDHNIQLDTLSKSDALTGIYNRRGFVELGKKIIEEAESNLVVSYIDMNNLKIINDRYGHEEGDWSLITIAECLKKIVGESGIVARLGGDEFAVITDNMVESEFKNAVNSVFEEINEKSPKEYLVTVSVGSITVNPNMSSNLESILAAADAELYRSKAHKINVVEKRGRNK